MTMEHPDHDRVHRITDAYREEQRDNAEPDGDSMEVDAIEFAIDNMLHHYNITNKEYVSAKEQLAALIENQIPGRCKDCDGYDDGCKRFDILVEKNDYCSSFTKREA